ncbi:MAG: hypothetical protein GX433_05510 [Deltaproteobacteria bacterium]|jgi:predicted secreted protein|nr:hypothetical protein [Deltaproteobacteria bacterium]
MSDKKIRAGSGKELRLRALEIYLERRGNITHAELGRLVGRDRKAIGRWATEDRWDLELHKLVGEVTEKASKKVADSLTDIVTQSFKKDFEFLQLTDQLFAAKLVKKDAFGKPLLNADGKFVIDDSMSTVDAARLVDARLKKIKAIQSIAAPHMKGSSTPSAEASSSYQPFNVELNAEFSRIVREDPEAQAACLTLLRAAGTARANVEGHGA